MPSTLFFIAVFAFVLLFVLIIWLLTIVFASKSEASDSTLTLNFLSHFDNGFFIGAETSSVGAKDNYHYIKFLPKDVNVKNNATKIKEVDVIVEKNKYLSFPKGTLSKERNISMLLPKTASDFHEAVKDSVIGKGLMLGVELQNAANIEIESLLQGHLRKDDILKRIGHAEISKEFLSFQTELYHDALKFAFDVKNRDKTSVSSPLSITKKD